MLGAGLAGIGEPVFEGAPQSLLRCGHGRRTVFRDGLAEFLRSFAKSFGGSTISETMPNSRARSASMRSYLPMNAMRMTASTGIFFINPIASMATTWPTETCGSKNWASLAAITMSASATSGSRRHNRCR